MNHTWTEDATRRTLGPMRATAACEKGLRLSATVCNLRSCWHRQPEMDSRMSTARRKPKRTSAGGSVALVSGRTACAAWRMCSKGVGLPGTRDCHSALAKLCFRWPPEGSRVGNLGGDTDLDAGVHRHDVLERGLL